jgi:GWxTD domain-containing protein
MRKVSICVAVLAAAHLVFAGGLSKKYKSWEKSPEAYFLTPSERAQWKKIQTDADAQNFILDYKAKRGPDFEKMLSERVAAADKYFSAGETKGSETLRGKVIIVFGPPSDVDNSSQKKTPTGTSLGPAENINSGGRNGGSEATGSFGASPLGTAPPHAQSPTIIFSYDEASAPKAIGKKFKVELKLISDSYQESWDEKNLNAKFEAVAQASIVPPETKQTPKPEKP